MEHEPLLVLAGVAAVGVAAQWLAWKVRLPSILVLLLLGAVAGGSDLLQPDELLGDLLFPVVSLSVALILFEGSLNIGRRELREAGRATMLLVTLGASVTFVVLWAAGVLLLEVDAGVAALVAANLIVTGPTVIGPLMQQVRPRGRVGAILRAEGIVIDPIGAVAAIVVFELILANQLDGFTSDTAATLGTIAAVGIGAGLAGAVILVVALDRFLLPDHLRQPAVVAMVLFTFAVADQLQEESGLVAVTVLGLTLANQQRVDLESLNEFAESLQVLVLSALFLILAARLDLEEVGSDLGGHLALLAVAVLVARPLAVMLSTIGTGLNLRERAFIAAVAPRGIVAAAIASVFAIRLEQAGIAGSERFAGAVVTVLIGTIVVYSISARWMGKRLRVAESERHGVLIVGAHAWGTQLAEVLREHGLRTLIIDRDRAKVVTARRAGQDTVHGSVLSQRVRGDLDLEGIGHLLALTTSDEVNGLAIDRLRGTFGRSNVWQLPTADDEELEGRALAWPDHETIERRLAAGARLRSTRLSERFGWEQYRERNPGATALALLRGSDLVLPATDHGLAPRPGDVLIALAKPPADTPPADTKPSQPTLP